MPSKPPSISAGPASSDDSFSFTEDQVTAGLGILFFEVTANDSKKSTLYSIDNAQVSELLGADPVSVAEQSQLGAAIWITADGRVGYHLDNQTAQGLAEGETLQDSFLYAVKLPNGSLVWNTVRITVTGTNDAPVATADVALASEDALTTGSVAANDHDIDHGAVLSYSLNAPGPAGFTMASDGSWAFDGSDPAWQSLAAGAEQPLLVSYTVTDEHGASTTSTLTLTLIGANDAPVTTSGFASVDEDGATSGQLFALDQDNVAGLTFAAAGDAPDGFSLAADGSWTFDASSPAYQALADGQFQIVEVPFTVTDEHGAASASSLLISINGVNDAPDAQDATVDLQLTRWEESQPLTGAVTASDSDDGTALTYFAFGPPGFAMNSDGSWTYEPSGYDAVPLAEGEVLRTYVQYQVTDEHGATDTAILFLNLIGANDAPITQPVYVEASEDQVIGGVYAAFDPDHGAVVTYTTYLPYGQMLPPGFLLNPDGSWSFDASDPAYQFLAEGQTLSFGIGVTATDEYGASSNSGIGITVTGVNDAALFDGQFVGSVTEAGTSDPGTPQATGQLGVYDVDGDSSFVAVSGGASASGYGSFSITAGGAWTYTLDNSNPAVDRLVPGQHLPDSFIVTAADGTTTTVYVDIAGSDDSSTQIGGATSGGVVEARNGSAGTPVAGGTLTIIADDPHFTAVGTPTNSDGGFGKFTITADGVWQYSLDNFNAQVNALNKGQTLGDSFTVHAADGTAQQIHVTIQGATDWVTIGVYPNTNDPNNRDTLVGPAGTDNPNATVIGTSAGEIVTGGSANQTFDMQGGSDTVYGGSGDDIFYGGDGGDVLMGQAGNDLINGDAAGDFIYGGSGNDTIFGGADFDQLYGGSGVDFINGGTGRDVIIGGYNFDQLTGGADGDTFTYLSVLDSGDQITDFQVNLDGIDLRAIDPNGQLSGDQAFAFSADGAAAFSVWFVQNGSNLEIYADTDGFANTAEFMITLQNVTWDPGQALPNLLL